MTTRLQTFGDIRLPCFVQPYPDTIQTMLREIQQFRPIIPFQSKNLPALKRNTWFVLQRPTDMDHPRSGFIVISDQYCVFVQNHQSSKIVLLRFRSQSCHTNEFTIFSATLSKSLLTIEDTLVWKGRNQQKERFSTRWAHAVQWMDTSCLIDPRLLGGLRVELAKWDSLSSLSIQNQNAWEFVEDVESAVRLLWFPYTEKATERVKERERAKDRAKDRAKAKATRDECRGPEQWHLTSPDGKSMGYALVRTLAVSEMLRSVSVTTLDVDVDVAWNPTFQKWEILLHNTRECTERGRGSEVDP